ncbi:MAG TPA: Fe2+-dependent dioxygenase [Beijerinckiaceae bacterium]|jgi:PKHD-type hydroxylase
MILCVESVLTPEDIAEARAALAQARWRDGRRTAGWNARPVKHNEQCDSTDRAAQALAARLLPRVESHPLFAAAVRPQVFGPVFFNRYAAGMTYGAHVDDALMGGVRTDVSFTLFLDDPADYDGGDLVIDTSAGEYAYKLPPGGLLIYPSTTLHRVEPVTRGERRALVGWAQSHVRSAERRELLFDLDRARRALFEREGKTPELDLLSKCQANLLRMWAQD